MSKSKVIVVKQTPVGVIEIKNQDYISLTDMVKSFGDENIIYHWMRNRNTVEFLGIWEQLHNNDFKGTEFDTFKKQASLNNFTLTPRKWIEATGAIGIVSKAGRYGGGTYAHKDIAFEFGSWLSPEFKLYLIKEFQRLPTPGHPGNMRDEATLEQLVVLTNLESINAVFVRQELPQADRLKKLNEIAISQMKSLLSANITRVNNIKSLIEQ